MSSGILIVPATGSGAAAAIKSATGQVDVSAATAPTTGQVLTATDGTHATWQTPAGGAPSGTAGGMLLGTYPNPNVDGSKVQAYSKVATGYFEAIPWYTAVNGISINTQDLHITYFTAPYGKPITSIGVAMAGAGTTGSQTLGKIAIWAANANGTTAAGPLFVSANDSTLGVSGGGINSLYTQTVSLTLTAGQRYGIGVLLVHSFSVKPKIISINTGLGNPIQSQSPVAAAVISGQSDIPAGAIASAPVDAQPLYVFCS